MLRYFLVNYSLEDIIKTAGPPETTVLQLAKRTIQYIYHI